MSQPSLRVLFLAQRVPYPPNRGDKISTFRLIERLARQHEVVVAAFETDDDDAAGAEELRRRGYEVHALPLGGRLSRLARLGSRLLRGEPLTLGWYGGAAMQAAVDRLAPECDLAYAYSSSMGAFLRPHTKLRRVMHFAELDSDKWRQYSLSERWPKSWIYAREHRKLLEFETEIAHSFDANVFCTPLEQDVFERAIPGAPSVVIKNGVDLAHLGPTPNAVEPGHLVFVGVMDYLPNIDGCVWFAEEIFPRVRERHPQARFTIVGSKPTPEVQALAALDGVSVTGFVDDPADYLHRAAISVAPLRIARGIQNKVLEAMAMGLPVVGTTSATQGVGAPAGERFLLADDAAGFATAVNDLLDDPARAAVLGAAARNFVEQHYSWESVLDELDALVDTLRPATPKSAIR